MEPKFTRSRFLLQNLLGGVKKRGSSEGPSAPLALTTPPCPKLVAEMLQVLLPTLARAHHGSAAFFTVQACLIVDLRHLEGYLGVSRPSVTW